MATLLFLPGTLCDARVWEPVRAALAGDWRGVHADYRHETSIAAMARQALAAADGELIPIGLSMGAIVALEIWRLAPQRVRALALFGVNPAADIAARRDRRDRQVGAALAGALDVVARNELAPAYFTPSDRHPALAELVASMAVAHGPAAFMAQSEALGGRRDYWPMLPQIDAPTLLACGEHDLICPPEQHRRMRALMQAARYTQIPDAGHLAPVEQAEAVGAALREWLHQLP
ncbi:alpha/beta fold hydrolase [Duganella aceris]|uniref:Alpha/beta fold hydrolase n=1 Tax=Duganella aceris TaxID=2703883 RepID=A0ABX0FV19_9BURK|nr:alpha/beta fold hydrolase [Duganella aceris]NGZ88303.1 alpha/beta fold hydrolase [Duganella aceris]